MTRPPVLVRDLGDRLIGVDGMPRSALATVTGSAMVRDGELRCWRVPARYAAAIEAWCVRAGRPVEVVRAGAA